MALIKETDFGTPARVSETLVTLEIDGKRADRRERPEIVRHR
jgi:formate dehydrogenase major subunit